MRTTEPDRDIAAMVARTVVHTHDFRDAARSFDELMRTGTVLGGLCLLIIGESGVGKSTLLRIFSKGFDPTRTAEGWFRPLLQIGVPTAPTAISFFEALLLALGDPFPTRGTRGAKKARVVMMLRDQGVKLLFLDDFQHFLDRDSNRILFDASEALKEILLLHPLCVVCAGLSSAKAVVASNEQLQRRHMGTISIKRFDWSKQPSRLAFMGVLRKFAESFDGIDSVDFTNEQVALRFFLATGGIMDFVAKIFVGSATAVQRTRSKVLTLDILARAWKTMLYHSEAEPLNPFLKDLGPNTAELVARAMYINAEVATAPKRRTPGTRLKAVGL